MTLNRVMAVIFRHFTQAVAIGANYVKLTEARPIVSATKNVAERFYFWHYMIHLCIRALLSDFSRKLANPIFSLFELCNTARPFQQQLSFLLFLISYIGLSWLLPAFEYTLNFRIYIKLMLSRHITTYPVDVCIQRSAAAAAAAEWMRSRSGRRH